MTDLDLSIGMTRIQHIADVMRERLCRYRAQERGLPYEEVLRQSLIESQALMAGYNGDGTIADTMRYARRRRLEASAAAVKAAQSL